MRKIGARALAILLIVLAVSPFTAPFAVCDLAVAAPVHQDSDSMSAAKILQDTTAVAFQPAGAVRLVGSLLVQPSSVSVAADAGRGCSPVLRL